MKLLLGLVAALVMLEAWQVFLVVRAPSVQQYQYTVESPSDELLFTCLSNLGSMGWEVVSTRRVTVQPRRLLSPASEVTEIIGKRPTGQAGIMNPPPDLGCGPRS